MTNLRRLLFGCVLCSLLASCENSNYESERQEETSMFSLFKKKYPTTVNPLLQAELQRIESFPAMPANAAPISGSTCTKYAVSGKPPEVVLSEVTDKLSSSIGFVVGDQPDNAVLLMNVSGNESTGTQIEAWQLASAQDLRLTRKIPIQVSPDQDSWVTRLLKEAVCLPHGRTLLIIGGYNSKSGARTDSFIYNFEQQKFSPFFGNIQLTMSRYLESQRLSAEASVVRYLSEVKREGPELYFNYYHRFQLFTRTHPDGVELLKLGIDIGNAKRWAVMDKKLYLHTHDPRTPSNARDAYWSLDLSKLLAN